MTLRKRAEEAAIDIMYGDKTRSEIADAIEAEAKRFAADVAERLFMAMSAGVPAGDYDGHDFIAEAIAAAEGEDNG